jgi:hypothetical protein
MSMSNKDEMITREVTKYAVTLRQDGKEVKFHDYDMVIMLMDLHRVLVKVIPSKAPLFRWCERGSKLGPHDERGGCIKPLSLGKQLKEYLSMNIDGYHDEFPKRVFHPLIELFGKYAPDMCLYANAPTKSACDRLNQCIEAMRAEARTDAFRRKRDAHLRSSRDANKELQIHVDKYFHRCGRALAVRLDLSYHIDETHFLTSSNKERSNLVSEPQARAHRDALIRYLKRKYRLRLQTYAWKEELGRFTSYHYHLLLFFDGNVSRSGFVVGNEIGDYWTNVITGKKGRYHNCAYDKHLHAGIGLINYWDVERLKALKEIVVPYLTKSDYFIRLVTKGRIFGKGGLPPKPRHGRGRPRKYRPLAPSSTNDYQPSYGMNSVSLHSRATLPAPRTPGAPDSVPFRL